MRDIESFEIGLDLDRYTAELFRSMDSRLRSGPIPLAGDYTLTHGREISKIDLTLYAIGHSTNRAVVVYTAHEVMKTPERNVSVSYQSDRTAVDHGVVRMSSSDEFYYPFKGIVDWILGKD